MPASLKPQFTAFAVTTAAIVSCAIGGCRSSGDADTKRIQAQYDPQTGRLTRLDYDANNNGKPDSWAFMDGTRIIRFEADENEDGKIDRWEYYNVALQTARGKPIPERIERATRRDGRVSRREFFEAGALARIEEDTDGDGANDKWSTYAGGTLSVLALDTQRRGTPDRRLIYRSDGTLERIEVDPTGKGQFQPLKP